MDKKQLTIDGLRNAITRALNSGAETATAILMNAIGHDGEGGEIPAQYLAVWKCKDCKCFSVFGPSEITHAGGCSPTLIYWDDEGGNFISVRDCSLYYQKKGR